MTTPSAAQHLASTRAVAQAGRRLQDVLETDRAGVERAVLRLERAADEQEERGAAHRAFLFSELAQAPSDAAEQEGLTDEALGAVLIDLDVGNVLIAAGQATGEIREIPDDLALSNALRRLENSRSVIDRSLGGGAQRFAFAEETPVPILQASPDRKTAGEAFDCACVEVLATLVAESDKVVGGLVKKAADLDQMQFLRAVSDIGGSASDIGAVGRLVRRGLEKIQRATAALVRLVGAESLESVREVATRLWESLGGGALVSRALAGIYNSDAICDAARQTAASDHGAPATLDTATSSLRALELPLTETMRRLAAISGAIAFASPILHMLAPISGGTTALVAVAAYAALLGTTLFIGLDYADGRWTVGSVRGVARIVDDAGTAK